MVLLFCSKAIYSSTGQLKTFKTDYCTGFPEGTFSKPNLWKDCCYDHDLRYWFGGSKADELLADQNLGACVSRKTGSNFYGNLMYYAVRTGHYSPIKHSTKWGWGWGANRSNYRELSNIEKEYIVNELELLDLDSEYLASFIQAYNL